MFRYDMNYDDVTDRGAISQEFRETLSSVLDVPLSEIQIQQIISGSVTIIIKATTAIVAALATVDIDGTAKTLMVTTIAGGWMGAVIASALGPLGTAVGGAIGAGVGLSIGLFATRSI